MLCKQPYSITNRDGSKNYYPCGRCLHCRIQRSREWSFRLIKELGYWDKASFLTLTYDDSFNTGSLNKVHLTNFFREVRRDHKISYFACGEYGEKTFRPHYHAIVFGYNPESEGLGVNEYWKYGLIYKGSVTRDSARYVCDYIFSAYDGEKGRDFYDGVVPPFRLVSKGIGRRWVEDNEQQISQRPYLTDGGVEVSIPRYFLKRMKVSALQNCFRVDEAGHYFNRTGESAVEEYKEQESSPVMVPLANRLQVERNLVARHRTKQRD